LRLVTTLKISALCLALAALPALPAVAGQAENTLLQKYAGSWKGSGNVTGPDPGTVSCRLTMKGTTPGKLTYTGRCSFTAGAASFRGGIVYNDANKRFEASSSAQGVATTTVGKRSGGGVVFSSSGMETRYGTASSSLSLTGGSIKMSFKLVDKDGQTMASSITFAKN